MSFFSRLKDTYKNTIAIYAEIVALKQEMGASKQRISDLVQEIVESREEIIASRKEIAKLRHAIVELRQETVTVRNEFRKTEDVIYNVIAPPISDDDIRKCLSYRKIRTLRQLLPVYDVKGRKFVRLGGEGDGGYVMIDEFGPSMIAYSFGINRDVSWDKEMVNRGIHCFMYDHTIERLPEENPLFHWKKIGISGNSTTPDCQTLTDLITQNDHVNHQNMILKMDVEGAE